MRTLIIILATSLLLSSCDFFGGERISGNGNITTQQRNVGNFSGVDVQGSATIRLRQDATPSVKIETDENLLQYLDVYTSGSTLVIKPIQGYNLSPSKDLIVYVAAPEFKAIDASGACNVASDSPIGGSDALSIEGSGSVNIQLEVNLPKLTSHISGSGDVVLKGTAKEFEGSISGSGSIKAFDLITDNSSLHLSGSANAQVTANQKLDIEVSGSGDIEYKGNASVSQHISGSGSVKKV